jgi:hypothetical protein
MTCIPLLRVYSKCFSGVQMVDWLVETMDEDKLR